jgi:pilus assembly protein CpaF
VADSRPRNQRPRKRGGKSRLADRAVIERHNQHISALREALEPEAESLVASVPRVEVVDRIRAQATAMAKARLEGDVSEVVEATLDEIFGLGPLEPLLRDPQIRTLRLEGADLYAEGERVARGFRDEAHAHTVINRILAAVDKTLNDGPDGVAATMLDGSTVRARLDGGRLRVDITRP